MEENKHEVKKVNPDGTEVTETTTETTGTPEVELSEQTSTEQE